MNYEFNCVGCSEMCGIESEDLPDRACDDTEYECEKCGVVMDIGWRAEVEVRGPSKVIDTDRIWPNG